MARLPGHPCLRHFLFVVYYRQLCALRASPRQKRYIYLVNNRTEMFGPISAFGGCFRGFWHVERHLSSCCSNSGGLSAATAQAEKARN